MYMQCRFRKLWGEERVPDVGIDIFNWMFLVRLGEKEYSSLVAFFCKCCSRNVSDMPLGEKYDALVRWSRSWDFIFCS